MKVLSKSSICSTLAKVKACLDGDVPYALVSGPVMKSLLLSHGAKEEEMKMLESGVVHQQLLPDQQMIQRRNGAVRWFINTVTGRLTQANTHVLLQTPDNEIVSEDIRRAGNRYFAMAPTIYQQGSVSPAFARIFNCLQPEDHLPQENLNTDHVVSVQDQFLHSVKMTENMDESFGPSPEGIHQDNSELVSVTMIGRYNITSGGESRLWKMSAPTGPYLEEEFESGAMAKHLIFSKALTDPWQTLIFNDRKLKHEARAFDGPRPCVRNIILNMIRKPLKGGKFGFDHKLEKDSLVPID